MRGTVGLLVVGLTLLAIPVPGAEPPGGITGTVLDPDGHGLPGVLVVVARPGAAPIRVASGEHGIFHVSGLAPASYAVHAELEGFDPTDTVEVSVEAGADASATLGFARPVYHESAQVTAARDVVTVTEVRESAARDVGEAMVGIVGVAKVRKAGIANDVVVRGLQRDNINVMVDGERIYGACPNRMDSPAFHVDFSEIDHIELTKGPFDIENQGSLGGIVNIVTRRPDPGLHGNATLVGGSWGFINPSLTGSWAGDTVAAAAGFSYRSSSPYRDGEGRRFTEITNYRPSQIGADAFRVGTGWAKLAWNPRAGESLELAYTRQQADGVLYPGLTMDAVYDNTDRLGVGWFKDDAASAVTHIEVRAYATRVHHWMTDEFRTSAAGKTLGWSMGTMAATSTAGGKAAATIGGFKLGVELFRRNWDNTTQLAMNKYALQASVPNVNTTGAGVFASRHLALSPVLGLDLGARFDRVQTVADRSIAPTNLFWAYNSTRSTSAADTTPSATARLTWTPSGQAEIALGVGSTVRVPDPVERYYALQRTGTDWVGNPDVKPTRNDGADLRATWRHSHGSVGGSLFYYSLKDYIAVHNQTRVNNVAGVMNTTARSYANVDARMRGAEAEVVHALSDRLFLGANASWVRGDKATDPSRLIFSPYLAEVPALSSRISVRYDAVTFYGEIEGEFAAAQNRVDTDLQEETTPGYGVLNLKAGATLFGLRVQAELGNVFNRAYTEHLACTRDPFHAGVRVYEPGRTLTVNVLSRF